MYTQRIPDEIVQEADQMSKQTGIAFRDILEAIYGAYLRDHSEEVSGYVASPVCQLQ